MAENETSAIAWQNQTWTPVPSTSPVFDTALSCSCAGPDTCMLAGVTADDLAMAQLWDGTSWSLLSPISP